MDEDPTPRKGNKRHNNRVAAMQYLYAYSLNEPSTLKDGLFQYFNAQEEPREYYAFAEDLINGAIENIEDVDKRIQGFADNWSFDRIAKVDLAILRLAIYELSYRTDIPPVVSINEAIDLSKEFSSDESKRFINGILDRFKDTLDRPLRSAAD